MADFETVDNKRRPVASYGDMGHFVAPTMENGNLSCEFCIVTLRAPKNWAQQRRDISAQFIANFFDKAPLETAVTFNEDNSEVEIFFTSPNQRYRFVDAYINHRHILFHLISGDEIAFKNISAEIATQNTPSPD